MLALDSYREYLTNQCQEIDDELAAIPMRDLTSGLAKSLHSELCKHLDALNLLNSYTADIASPVQ